MPAPEFNAQLLGEIGSALGIDGLAFDEEGVCLLAVDEMPVAIQAGEHGWQLSGFVAEVAEGEELEELTLSADQWRSILELNHALLQSGIFATLTYDKEAECVLFVQPLQENQLEAGQVTAQLETFVFRLEEIRGLVDAILEEESAEDRSETMDGGMAMLNQLV